MQDDLLIRWCRIQYETLAYIEQRSRSANRFVAAQDMAKALKISQSAAGGRLKRYCLKGWLKEQKDESERKYVLRLEGLQRLQWLEHLQTQLPGKEFTKKLETEGIELADWISEEK